jgi:four helix bundle protein
MQEKIKHRTQNIGLEVIKLIDEFPNKVSSWAIAKQIVRCATSVGANYRAACRAKSLPDFVNKLKIVEEEADETLYWLEIIEKSELTDKEKIAFLSKEVNEILSIIVASIRTAKSKIPNPKSKIVNRKS